MIRDRQSESEHDPDDQCESVFNTLEELAEYARARNLARADEFLAEIVGRLLTYRTTIRKAE